MSELRRTIRHLTDRTASGDRWLVTTDPPALDAMTAELAVRLAPLGIEALMCWDHSSDAVLAHSLGSAMGVTVLRAQLDLGILTLDGSWPDAPSRVALLSSRWDPYARAETLARLCERDGHPVTAVVSVLEPAPRAQAVGDGLVDITHLVAELA